MDGIIEVFYQTRYDVPNDLTSVQLSMAGAFSAYVPNIEYAGLADRV
jgi:hypothetical protein